MKLDSKIIDDIAHVLWGAFVAWIIPPVAPHLYITIPVFAVAIPRELEQLFNAPVDKSFNGFKDHIQGKPGWLQHKIRDIAGFAVGGLPFAVAASL